MATPTLAARRRRTRLAALVAAGALVTGLASACSSAVDADKPGTDAGPAAGGTLQVVAAADAQPVAVMGNRAGNWSWRRLVFESLLRIEDGTPKPELATEWSWDESRTLLSLTLRDDVTFHSGRAMTADDVVFTLDKVKDPANGSQLAGVAAGITSVKAVDDTHVEITLAAPNDSMLDLLDLTPIVDEDTFAGLADGSEVVGTGPFVWKSWQPGASIVLSRNDDYRVPERPYLDEVDISIVTDPAALSAALRGGSADIAIGMAQSDVTALKSDDDYAVEDAGGVFYPFGVDVTQPPFDQPQARQALAYALDRERISDQVFGGDAVQTDLWFTPGAPGYPGDQAEHYTLDPDKAKQLLEDSGAAGASLEITYANLPVMTSLFEVIQNNLSAVGLKVKANPLDVTEYDKRQVEGKLGQSFLLLHGMVGFSPATILSAMPSVRPGNPSHFDTPEYTELRKAVVGADDSTRDQAVAELSTYMLDQAFSNIVLVAPQYHVRSAALHDLDVFSLGSLVATDAYLTR